MIPGAIVIAGCAALAWGMRRSKPIITFAILWIAITMAIPSNLLMVTGFVLAERTLFLSSAGIVLIVAVAASEAWRMMGAAEAVPRRVLVVATGLLLVFGVARSTTRNPAWRDNDTLFRQTVEDVPFSSRAHLMLAQHLSLTKHSRDVLEEVMLAMALGRKDDVLLLGVAADQFHLSGMCGRAIPIYRRALALTPRNEQLRANTALCLMRLGRIDEAREIAMSGFQINRTSPVLIRSVALADSLTRVAHDRTLRIAR